MWLMGVASGWNLWGDFQLIFVIPEALFANLEWKNMLCTDVYRTNLMEFVVDEAHCVKKW